MENGDRDRLFVAAPMRARGVGSRVGVRAPRADTVTASEQEAAEPGLQMSG